MDLVLKWFLVIYFTVLLILIAGYIFMYPICFAVIYISTFIKDKEFRDTVLSLHFKNFKKNILLYKFHRHIRDYLKHNGWKIVWDIKTFRRICISRRGFRIPLKDAYSYIRKHGDPTDIFYWGDVFDLWNRTSEEM